MFTYIYFLVQRCSKYVEGHFATCYTVENTRTCTHTHNYINRCCRAPVCACGVHFLHAHTHSYTYNMCVVCICVYIYINTLLYLHQQSTIYSITMQHACVHPDASRSSWQLQVLLHLVGMQLAYLENERQDTQNINKHPKNLAEGKGLSLLSLSLSHQ